MILLLFSLAAVEIEPVRWKDLSFVLNRSQLQQGYEQFVWLGAAQNLWYMKAYMAKEADYSKRTAAIWITGAVTALFLSLFLLGIYGAAGQEGLMYPLASAMTLAHFPGNVIGRLDAVFVLVWVIGLFLLCSTLFAPLQADESGSRGKIFLAAGMAGSFVLALFPQGLDWCWKFLCYVSMPVQILLLLWQGAGKKRLLFFIPVVFLTGCGQQELEEQSLAMTVGIDVGEAQLYYMTFGFGEAEQDGQMDSFSAEGGSLAEGIASYQAYTGKKIDFNHLKKIYLSEQLLREDCMGNLLEEFQTDSTYSRGTGVYAVQGRVDAEAVKEEQPEGGILLHRILNAYYNEEVCEIPVVRSDGMYKGYISWPY
jgi:hypothetical protein